MPVTLSGRNEKKTKFDFHKMGIRRGQQLHFTKDHSVTLTVASKDTVWLFGEELNLTQATRQALGRDEKYKVNGAFYWTHKGHLLRDIYDKTYT